jgi:hypothetical protein
MWTKYEFICTECDTLMEITTYLKSVDEPRCPCPHQAIVRVNKFDLEGGHGVTAYEYEPVIKVTPSEVVKINTNPYN